MIPGFHINRNQDFGKTGIGESVLPFGKLISESEGVGKSDNGLPNDL